MRRLVFSLTLLLVPLAAGAEMGFLFIGNSHSPTHLTTRFEGLAIAAGHIVLVQNSTFGGSTLSYHTHHQPTIDAIESRQWDYVILQEHTLLPVIPYWVQESFYPSAAKLDSMITANGSRTALFAHQAYPYPDGEYCVFDHCSPEFYDYFDMQEAMSAPYVPLAQELDAPLARVGDAWAAALQDDPSLPLWSGDELHASVEGLYFTACVIFVTLFGENPVGLPYYGDLDEATALQYQQLAWGTVTRTVEAVPSSYLRELTCRPNPFNPTTEIVFEVLVPTMVELEVFDLAGRLVRRIDPGTHRESGFHRLLWDGRNATGREMPSGVYFSRLEAGRQVVQGTMTLVR